MQLYIVVLVKLLQRFQKRFHLSPGKTRECTVGQKVCILIKKCSLVELQLGFLLLSWWLVLVNLPVSSLFRSVCKSYFRKRFLTYLKSPMAFIWIRKPLWSRLDYYTDKVKKGTNIVSEQTSPFHSSDSWYVEFYYYRKRFGVCYWFKIACNIMMTYLLQKHWKIFCDWSYAIKINFHARRCCNKFLSCYPKLLS